MDKARMLYEILICKRCFFSLANRRQLAFVIDFSLLCLLFLSFVTLVGGARTTDEANTWFCAFLLVFFLKDGFGGYSPGKALLRLRVINEITGKSIGFRRSFQRNLPLIIPFMPLVVAIQLHKGHRTGDKWAASKVIWKRYASHPIFLAKSNPEYKTTPAEVEMQAKDALSRAFKLEARGLFEDALTAYRTIAGSFPQTLAATDARKCIDDLEKRMKG